MLKIYKDKVVIEGHEQTKEQCETMTLLANALKDSKDFKVVDYKNGYAEFEKVGKSNELKFVALYSLGAIYIFAPNDTTPVYIGQDTTDNMVALSATIQAKKIEYEGSFPQVQSNDYVYTSDDYKSLLTKEGYEIDYIEYPNIVGSGGTVYNVGDTFQSVSVSGLSIYIHIKQSSTQKSVDLTTLGGWNDLADGTHNITVVAKGTGYQNSDASDSVQVTKSSGETWVLNETLDVFDGMPPTTNILFISNGTQYSKISNSGGITASILYDTTEVYSYEFQTWTNTAYRTLTFDTAPTGDLLAWLEVNGTKQTTRTITKGTYVWNDTISAFYISFLDIPIMFVCNYVNYIKLDVKYIDIDDIQIWYYTDNVSPGLYAYGNNTWFTSDSKTIEITEDTLVYDAFYTWFTSNTTKQ